MTHDPRLLDQMFNPIDDPWSARETAKHVARGEGIDVVRLFDRAMLAAMPTLIRSMTSESEARIAAFAADYALACLEERAKRMGIEVKP